MGRGIVAHVPPPAVGFPAGVVCPNLYIMFIETVCTSENRGTGACVTIVSDKPIRTVILFYLGDQTDSVMSTLSQWLDFGVQFDEETREELTQKVAGWSNGLRRIPHA